MKYLLISFGLMLLCFAGFLVSEEPSKRTLWEWAANIILISSAANCFIALGRFCLIKAE